MKKIMVFICCLCVSIVVDAEELDDMIQLESLFNLDLQQIDVESNNVIEVVAEEENSVKVEDVVVTEDISSLSKDEMALELAASKQEVVRLKDIVGRILIANRRERAEMQYNLGCVYQHSGYNEKAEEAFLSALKINPDDSSIHYNLGILYDENLKIPKKAREHYKRFLELAPDDKDADKVYKWMMALE